MPRVTPTYVILVAALIVETSFLLYLLMPEAEDSATSHYLKGQVAKRVIQYETSERSTHSLFSLTNGTDKLGYVHGVLANLKARVASIEKKQMVNSSGIHQLINELNDVVMLCASLAADLAQSHSEMIAGNSGPPVDQLDVCPEPFAHTDLSGGYPFFYKGFDMTNCSNALPLQDILTVAFNFNEYSQSEVIQVNRLLSNLHSVHAKVKVVVAANDGSDMNSMSGDISFIKTKSGDDPGEVWMKLIATVRTKYVYIGRDVNMFMWHSRLERLIREINGLNASVVASAFRSTDGKWRIGCDQVLLRNYTLIYTAGYTSSAHECVFCDYVEGPFVARTDLFRQFPLPNGVSHVSFRGWFRSLQNSKVVVVTCPDSMAFTREISEELANPNMWIPLAAKLDVERLHLSSGVVHSFPCLPDKACSKTNGMALSPCCMSQLSTMIKFFMESCKSCGSICELQEGTLLGAVKFSGVLPWERDGDITFSSANFSTIKNLAPKFSAVGYTLKTVSEPRCCVDGRVAGGVFGLSSKSWNIELYGQHLMDSELLTMLSLKPTVINFDGTYIGAPANPGLYVRNRYGHEIYKHVQHWQGLGHKSGWNFYQSGKFSACPTPGHHACLDQFIADGNLQFRNNLT